MKKPILLLAGLFLLLVLEGCATLRGMGEDAENFGKGLRKTVSESRSE